jgi:quercetin dioxygenase-like cupin family protein
MCKILKKLEELTPQLPVIPDLSKYKTTTGRMATYVFDSGNAISENVYSTPDIGIAKTTIKEGVTFDIHKHNISGEWIIVLNGVLKVFVDSVETELYKYDSIKIDAKKPHFAIAVTDTTFIAITVPKDDGFPE